MIREIAILILHENPLFRDEIQRELNKAGIRFSASGVDTRDNLIRTLREKKPDLILAAESHPSIKGIELLQLVRKVHPHTPVIVLLTGTSDTSGELLKAGAAGLVPSNQLYQVVPNVIDAISRKRVLEQRRNAEERLQQSEKQYRLLFEGNPQPMWILETRTLAFLNVNQAAIRLYGYSKEEFLSFTLHQIARPEDVSLLEESLCQLKENQDSYGVWRHLTQAQKTIEVELHSHPIEFEGKKARLCLLADVTERKQAEAALRESERRFRETLESIQMVALTLDTKGRITFCNDFLLQVTGWKLEELRGLNWFDTFIPATLREQIRSDFMRSMQEGKIAPHRENEIVTRSGNHRTLYWTNTLIRDVQGDIIGVTSIGQDVTERKWAEEALRSSEQRYRMLFERNLAGVYRATVEGRILDANESCARILGFHSPTEIMKHSMNEFYFHPAKKRLFLEELRRNQVLKNFETALKRNDGSLVWVLQNASLLQNDDGRQEIIEGTLIDITERKQAEERLQYLAHYDPLTDLPTRLLFTDRLRQALIEAKARNRLVGVLCMDLDRFKNINDTLGHDAGNLFLRQVAQRLAMSAQPGDTVSRSGADEFYVILRDIENVQQAADITQKVLASFEKPFYVTNRELYVTASVGISLYPMDGETSETLLKNSETAMYKAKDEGGNHYQFFTNEMQITLLRQISLETSLRHALERNEFSIDYQPKIDLKTGMIRGAEALVKWNHPQLGNVNPAQFIPLAEETGSIVAIGDWVLRTACRQSREWHKEGYTDLNIAVNLSPRQFKQKDLSTVIAQALEENELSASSLELEITETVLMQSTPDSLRKLRELKQLGIQIVIDDFGTGFSSLNYLRQFPIDTLKIDQSFVRDVPEDANDTLITRAIILLAHSLQLKVVAEGVETEEQLNFLRSEECDEVQGFLFSRPLSPAAFLKFLEQKKSRGEVLPSSA